MWKGFCLWTPTAKVPGSSNDSVRICFLKWIHLYQRRIRLWINRDIQKQERNGHLDHPIAVLAISMDPYRNQSHQQRNLRHSKREMKEQNDHGRICQIQQIQYSIKPFWYFSFFHIHPPYHYQLLEIWPAEERTLIICWVQRLRMIIDRTFFLSLPRFLKFSSHPSMWWRPYEMFWSIRSALATVARDLGMGVLLQGIKL